MDNSLYRSAQQSVTNLEKILLGKQAQIQQALICLFAGGHLLIEDLPGMGKTTLAQGLAKTLGLEERRVQFTSDMLPADILGASIFDRNSGQFQFHPGPVFTQLLLADEINRSSPKTQSALLEVMEERQVTVEGRVYPVDAPFFVIATQNPSTQFGTFPLPESQLDRFLMRISLGYPAAEVERAILSHGDSRVRIVTLAQTLNPAQILAIQAEAARVFASDEIIDYLQRLLAFTRESEQFRVGASPRAGLALLRAARACAWLAGRDHVLPDDLQFLLGPVLGHRLVASADGSQLSEARLIALLLEQVDVLP